jgi:hypothetical protein
MVNAMRDDAPARNVIVRALRRTTYHHNLAAHWPSHRPTAQLSRSLSISSCTMLPSTCSNAGNKSTATKGSYRTKARRFGSVRMRTSVSGSPCCGQCLRRHA